METWKQLVARIADVANDPVSVVNHVLKATQYVVQEGGKATTDLITKILGG